MIFKSFLKLICGSAMVIVSTSCVEKKDARIADPLYFNLNGFIDNLVLTMDSGNYSLSKEFIIGEKKELRTYTKINWAKELGHFKDCDINSPVLRETFEVKTLKTKDGTQVNYIPKEIRANRTELLSIIYDSNKNVKKISGSVVSSNILYSSKRKLYLNLQQVHNRTTVKDFSIKNKEELILNKPSLNQVKATVISSF